MGRLKLFDKYGLTRDHLIETYERSGSLKEAAGKLKMSDRTLGKYLRAFGYKMKTGPKINHVFAHYGCMIEFVRKFPNITFPRSINKIVELTGCTRNAVTTYLYRRRKKIRERLKRLPDLRRRNLKLKDTKGRIIPTNQWKSYEVYIDRWTVRLRIESELRNNQKVKFFARIEDLERRLKCK